MSDARDEETRWICCECVGEAYLQGEIATAATPHVCTFCGNEAPVITVDDLADRVEGAFEAHYYRTSDEPDALQLMMMRDRESTYDFEREGDPVLWAIASAAYVSEEVAQEVLDILSDRHGDFDSAAMGEETEFHSESYYERRGPNDVELQLDWQNLERSLKGETRFFNKAAEALLKRVFHDVEAFRASGGRRVIRIAGPGRKLKGFYRARVFHEGAELEQALARPDTGLGPPPGGLAPAGRMNAHGVSLFYGATHPEAALAEVRPPVGSRVLLARFDILRALRLLDVDALRSVYVEGSIFDPTYMGRLELAKFLERLSDRITMPVMKDDEPAGYLITQAIADYLASENDLNLDGLLYPSVQQAGRWQNVVLFRRASRVASLELPPGSDVQVKLEEHDEDGYFPDYWVWETVPEAKPAPEEHERFSQKFRPSGRDPFDEPTDEREPALSVASETMSVHHVEAIRIKTSPFRVNRHRFPKRAPKFHRAAVIDVGDDL